MYSNSSASNYWTGRIASNNGLNATLYFDEESTVNAGYDYWEKALISQKYTFNRTTTVLDIPTGRARWASYLADLGCFVTGVDISEGIIAEAFKATPPEAMHRCQYEVAFADNLPFRDESFDVVLCTGLFEHLPEEGYVKAAVEQARVLNRGGQIFLVLNNCNSRLLTQSNDNFYRKSKQLPNGYYCGLTNVETVLQTLSQNGVDVYEFSTNPAFSLMRRCIKGSEDLNISSLALDAAIAHDLTFFSNKKTYLDEMSDQIVLCGRKR